MDRPFPEPHPFEPDEPRVERPEQYPDDAMAAREERDRLEREFEERRPLRCAASRFYIACDRAAYERRHGTLDDPADRFRADAEPF